MKLYCLSGLGVDKRAFINLKPSGVDLIQIDWIVPLPLESIQDYAQRLFESVNPTGKYNLLGVSFGGLIAIEFAKIRKPERLFLVSSVAQKSDFPFSFKVASALKLYKLIPSFLLKSSNFMTFHLFGVKKKENKKLLTQILKDTDPKFLKWAMAVLLKWDNKENIDFIKIHGSNDKMIPLKGKPDYTIQGGGHFMIVTHADEISTIIEGELLQEKGLKF